MLVISTDKDGSVRVTTEKGAMVCLWTAKTDKAKIAKWLDLVNFTGELERAADALQEHMATYPGMVSGKIATERMRLSNVQDKLMNKSEKVAFGRIQT